MIMIRSTRQRTTTNNTSRTNNNNNETITTLPIYSNGYHNNNSSSSKHHNTTSRRYVVHNVIIHYKLICAIIIAFFITTFLYLSSSSNDNNNNNQRSNNTFFQSRNMKEINIDYPYYDVIIIGAGPAGLTASIFTSRSGYSTLLFGSTAESQLSQAVHLDNVPGSSMNIHGMDWLESTQKQVLSNNNLHWVQPTIKVLKVEQVIEEGMFKLTVPITEVQQVEHVFSRTVIVATGATSKRLHIQYEDKLWGKSIHSCAICDGSVYTKTDAVVVIGGGDAAIEAVTLLSRNVNNVILIHRNNEFRASNKQLLQSIQNDLPNVQIHTSMTLEQYKVDKDEKTLLGINVRNQTSNELHYIPCNGVFLMIGSTPNIEPVQNLVKLTKDGGWIETFSSTTSSTTTSIDGIFAIGEVTDYIYKQAITAAGQGAQAAIDTDRYMRLHNYKPHTNNNLPTNIPLVIKQQQQRKDQKIITKNFVIQQPNNDKEKQQQQQQEIPCDLTQQDCIETIVKQYPVVLFSKSYCPFCKKALEALSQEGVTDPFIIELSTDPKARLIQSTLNTMTGRRTVPNVFINGHSIGGGDETHALHRAGQLRSLLLEAHALSSSSCTDYTSIECIKQIVKEHMVVIFSKSFCPYCKRTIETFKVEGIFNPYVIDIDMLDNMSIIQDTLQSLTGRRTVPNIFINGNNIGGNDDITKLHQSGQLKIILSQQKMVKL